MAKVLVVGDTYGTNILEGINYDGIDKVVFMGNQTYTPTSNYPSITPYQAHRVFIRKTGMYRARPDDVSLLIGPEDLRWIFESFKLRSDDTVYPYSNAFRYFFNKPDYTDGFKVAVQIDDWIFSHGGISTLWLGQHIYRFVKRGYLLASEFSKLPDFLNAFLRTDLSIVITSDDGIMNPGPIFAKPDDVLENGLPNVHQVVHCASTKEIQINVDPKTNKYIVLTDTLWTPEGDKKIAIIDTIKNTVNGIPTKYLPVCDRTLVN